MLPEQALKRYPSYRKSFVGKFLHNQLHRADTMLSVPLHGSWNRTRRWHDAKALLKK